MPLQIIVDGSIREHPVRVGFSLLFQPIAHTAVPIPFAVSCNPLFIKSALFVVPLHGAYLIPFAFQHFIPLSARSTGLLQYASCPGNRAFSLSPNVSGNLPDHAFQYMRGYIFSGCEAECPPCLMRDSISRRGSLHTGNKNQHRVFLRIDMRHMNREEQDTHL